MSLAFGLSAKSEETAGSSADRRNQEDYMTDKDRVSLAQKTKEVEAAAAELEAAALVDD